MGTGTMDEGEDTAVADFLAILEEHRKNCERQGKYVEAEIAKNRLEELRLHEENRRREAMRSRQIAERLGVEEAHMLEFQQFNIIWDKKMAEYEQHAQELVQAMKERHTKELAEWQKKVIASSHKRLKFSKELLGLRKIQHCLAKSKDYQQAALMKARADNLEAELEKLGNQKQQDLHLKEQRFKAKRKAELTALFEAHPDGQGGAEEAAAARSGAALAALPERQVGAGSAAESGTNSHGQVLWPDGGDDGGGDACEDAAGERGERKSKCDVIFFL